MNDYLNIIGISLSVLTEHNPGGVEGYKRGYLSEAIAVSRFIYDNNGGSTYEVADSIQHTLYCYHNMLHPVSECVKMSADIKDRMKIYERIEKAMAKLDFNNFGNEINNKYYLETEAIFDYIVENKFYDIPNLADKIQEVFLEKHGILHSLVKCLEMAEIISGRL